MQQSSLLHCIAAQASIECVGWFARGVSVVHKVANKFYQPMRARMIHFLSQSIFTITKRRP